jgi:F-box and WD-40 domain protein 1/11
MTSSGKLINKFTGKHTSQIFDVKFDVSRIVRYVAAVIPFPTTYLQNSTSHDHHIVVLDFSHGLDASVFV